MIVDVEENAEIQMPVEQDAADLWLTRVRLRARRRARWISATSADAQGELTDGLVILHSQVERALQDPAETADAERQFYVSDRDARLLTDQIHLVDTAFLQLPACSLL